MSARSLEGPDPSVTSRRARAVLPATVIGVTFLLGTAGGFLFTRSPAPPEVRATLVSASATPVRTLRGTLAAVGTGSIDLTTSEGTRRLTLDAGVPVDALAPLTGTVAPGAATNVGGNRTENGFVITGVVVLEGTP